jgi:Flp pilus assembly protein TadG
MGRRRHGFRHNERGGVAIFFGFALPVLLVGAGAALEYA